MTLRVELLHDMQGILHGMQGELLSVTMFALGEG